MWVFALTKPPATQRRLWRDGPWTDGPWSWTTSLWRTHVAPTCVLSATQPPPLLMLSPTNFPTSLPDNTSGVSRRTPRLGRREGHRWDRHSVPLPSRRPGLCAGGAPGRHRGPRRGQGAPDPSEKPIQSRPLAQHVVGGASASERGEDRGPSARPGARVPSRAASPGLPLGALPGALPPGRPLLLLQPLLLLAGQV